MRRADSRAISPAKRISRQGTRDGQDGDPSANSAKGPDPADFESEFAIDDEYSRKPGAPKSQLSQKSSAKTIEETASQQGGREANETSTSTGESNASSDLPADVRDKLRKLEKYESRYHGMFGIADHPRPFLMAARAAQVLSRCPCESP